MNNAIKAGDLVMIVKPTLCCGNSAKIGKIFTVNSIESIDGNCAYCKREFKNIACAISKNGSTGQSLKRLIKIDPPALQDETENEKELAL